MAADDTQAIQHLKGAIAEGKHWYVALLEAIKLWASTEEDYDGRRYKYLIDGEAFDWLTLAERLCEEVDGLIPEKERINLYDRIFRQELPEAAIRDLNKLRRSGLSGEPLLDSLREIVSQYRLTRLLEEREEPAREPQATRIICSEALL